MHPDRVDAGIARRWLLAARDALGESREEIDALNVFPVPDGDTGTNMYLTLEAAVRGVGEATTDSLGDVLASAARGAFLGARGNSGVIFSQVFRAVADVLSRPWPDGPGTQAFAEALDAGARAGYEAVVVPVEGTMLTVMKAASDAAVAEAADGSSLARLVRRAVAAADDAVLATRAQNEQNLRAGVVDAGGRGIAVVLAAMDTAMTGRRARPATGLRVEGAAVLPQTAGADLVAGGPAYEVMYLLEADDEPVGALRRQLADLGDSLLVVGGGGLWNVHVHVDDVGAAVERGIEAGRPFRIRVTHFADQVSSAAARPRGGRLVVAGAAGPGLAALFTDAGARVVSAERGRLAATSDILAAVLDGHAAEAVVLPNHRELVPAAEAAAHEAGEHGVRVAVIPSRAQVQGLAALAVHQPSHTFDADVVAMTTAAGHVREGAVTVAVKEAMTTAGVCQVGDVLGVIGGDIVIIGSDLPEVALEVLTRMLASGGELVTVVEGAHAPDGLAEAVATSLAESSPHVDCVTLDGGQERYHLLLGVE
jgi:DAK2 domain fusion protein YloV